MNQDTVQGGSSKSRSKGDDLTSLYVEVTATGRTSNSNSLSDCSSRSTPPLSSTSPSVSPSSLSAVDSPPSPTTSQQPSIQPTAVSSRSLSRSHHHHNHNHRSNATSAANNSMVTCSQSSISSMASSTSSAATPTTSPPPSSTIQASAVSQHNNNNTTSLSNLDLMSALLRSTAAVANPNSTSQQAGGNKTGFSHHIASKFSNWMMDPSAAAALTAALSHQANQASFNGSEQHFNEHLKELHLQALSQVSKLVLPNDSQPPQPLSTSNHKSKQVNKLPSCANHACMTMMTIIT